MSLFKTNMTKNNSKSTRVNNMYGSPKKPKRPKTKKQSEEKTIRVMRT